MTNTSTSTGNQGSISWPRMPRQPANATGVPGEIMWPSGGQNHTANIKEPDPATQEKRNDSLGSKIGIGAGIVILLVAALKLAYCLIYGQL